MHSYVSVLVYEQTEDVWDINPSRKSSVVADLVVAKQYTTVYIPKFKNEVSIVNALCRCM